MKKILIFILPLFLLMTAGARSQDKTSKDSSLEYSFSLHSGISEISQPAINQILKSNGVPMAFDNTFFQVGGELDLGKISPKDRLTGGFDFTLSVCDNANQPVEVRTEVFEFGYMFNYLLFHNNRSFFYPSLGFGWMSYKMNYFNSGGEPGTFQDALNDFQGESSLECSSLPLIRVGLNYDWSVDKTRELFLGVQADYDIGLGQKSWELGDGSSLNDTPKSDANCFSTGIVLAFQ